MPLSSYYVYVKHNGAETRKSTCKACYSDVAKEKLKLKKLHDKQDIVAYINNQPIDRATFEAHPAIAPHLKQLRKERTDAIRIRSRAKRFTGR